LKEGVTFILLNNWNVALIGIECLIPFLQSLTRLLSSSSLSFVEILLLSDPEYVNEIFSYHFSEPAAFFFLNGYTLCRLRLREGKLREMVESRIFCDMFIELESDRPIEGKLRE
jgi:hypothetical protein